MRGARIGTVFVLGATVGWLARDWTAELDAAAGPSVAPRVASPEGVAAASAAGRDAGGSGSAERSEPARAEVEAARPAPRPRREAKALPPTSDAIVAEIRSMVAADAPWTSVKSRLADCARRGDRDAIEAVLRCLEDESIEFSHRAASFAEALHGVEDPAIYPRVRAFLDRELAAGASSWYEVNGLVALVAEHGGAAGAEFVLAQLRGDPPFLAGAAAEAIPKLRDESRVGDFLELAGKAGISPALAAEIVDGVAALGPEHRPALEELAISSATSAEAREAAYDQLARSLWSGDDLDRAALRFAAEPDTIARGAMLGALRGSLYSPDLDATRSRVAAFAGSALRDPDAGIRARALAILDDADPRGMPELAPIVAAAAEDETLSVDARRDAKRLSQSVARPARK
jgi:hypothetical protein